MVDEMVNRFGAFLASNKQSFAIVGLLGLILAVLFAAMLSQ